jgi:glycosyltransferase involved in cell wall biosynthesis
MLIYRVCSRNSVIIDDMILIHKYNQKWGRIFSFLMDIIALRIAGKIATASPMARDFLVHRYPEKPCLFLPNGCEVVDSLLAKQPITSNYKIEAILVGSLAFDQNFKAAQNLLEIIQSHKIDHTRISFNIVGGPSSRVKTLRNLLPTIPENVHFHGFVSDEDLHHLLRISRLGLLPFFYDTPLLGGSRTKALEYFSHGLLVLSGSQGIGGLPGIESGKHFLEAEDISSFAEILGTIVEDPQFFEKTRLEGYDFIKTTYLWSKLAEIFLNFISE